MERSEKILQGLGNQYYRATLKSMGFTTDVALQTSCENFSNNLQKRNGA